MVLNSKQQTVIRSYKQGKTFFLQWLRFELLNIYYMFPSRVNFISQTILGSFNFERKWELFHFFACYAKFYFLTFFSLDQIYRLILYLDLCVDDGHRYQIPLALVGLISSLALWDVFRYYGDHLGVDQYPLLRQIFVRIVQCGKCYSILKFLILFFWVHLLAIH